MSALAGLSTRERVLLLLALPIAILLAGWRLAWVPISDARAARDAEIAGYRMVAEAASRAGVTPLAAPAEAGPLATRVTASAEAAGLSLSRLEPEGEGLRVAVAEAGFAQVVLWLADLEGGDVLVSAVEMDRRTAPGAVSARVLVEDAR
jgi:general secretion pathway protein M